MLNCASGVANIDNGSTMRNYIFDCWNLRQILSQNQMSLLRPGDTYLVVTIKCCIGQIPGCESKWRWSNILHRNWAGTTGCMIPADILQVSKIPMPRKQMSRMNSNQIGTRTAQDPCIGQLLTVQNLCIFWAETWETSYTHYKVSAAGFVLPWMWRIPDINWDIMSKYRFCLGECPIGNDEWEYIKALWSMENRRS